MNSTTVSKLAIRFEELTAELEDTRAKLMAEITGVTTFTLNGETFLARAKAAGNPGVSALAASVPKAKRGRKARAESSEPKEGTVAAKILAQLSDGVAYEVAYIAAQVDASVSTTRQTLGALKKAGKIESAGRGSYRIAEVIGARHVNGAAAEMSVE